MLEARDFYNGVHRKIFNAFSALASETKPIDLTTLTMELRRTEALDQCGGPEYLATLTDGIPNELNVEHYAREIRETADKRRIIQFSNELITESYDACTDSN